MSMVVGLGVLGCGSTIDTRKIEYSKVQLELKSLQTYKNHNGLLVVDLKWNNLKVNGTPYRYQVFWLDSDGGVVSSADQGWRNTTMNHGHYAMRLVAKNTLATDFRLKIVKDK